MRSRLLTNYQHRVGAITTRGVQADRWSDRSEELTNPALSFTCHGGVDEDRMADAHASASFPSPFLTSFRHIVFTLLFGSVLDVCCAL